MMTTTATELETDRHLEELRSWLKAQQPREDWPAGQRRAYNDRMVALARWIAIAQQQEVRS